MTTRDAMQAGAATPAPVDPAGPAPADHRVLLPAAAGGRWALWRTVCVRAAGFPAAEALSLADAPAARAADRLAAAEAAAESARQGALSALRRELAAAPGERPAGLAGAIRRVKRRRPASPG